MKFIVIVMDTLRADHLGCYGNDHVQTPHLDRLAKMGTRFSHARAASFPTIPNRTDALCGRFGEPLHIWLPLSWDAVTLPDVLGNAGFVTMLIHDTPHLINHGLGFDRPFHAWWMIRGNEVDRFNTDPCSKDSHPLELECPADRILEPMRSTWHSQYIRNIRERTEDESTYFAPRVFSAAIEWLERNHEHHNFLLWIDCFDPHEPWDPPRKYRSMYDRHSDRPVATNFFNVGAIDEEELASIRACYAGEVTMVDAWLGRLVDKVEKLGIAGDTTIVATSDHGTGLGDRGPIQKELNRPMWQEIGRLPLIFRGPEVKKGHASDAIAQPPDLMPTLLELAGIPQPPSVQGRSLVPALRGEPRRVRDLSLGGTSPVWANNGNGPPTTLTVTDGTWAYHHVPGGESLLFNLEDDPRELQSRTQEEPNVAGRMRAGLLELLAEYECPKPLLDVYQTGDMSGFGPFNTVHAPVAGRLNPFTFLRADYAYRGKEPVR